MMRAKTEILVVNAPLLEIGKCVEGCSKLMISVLKRDMNKSSLRAFQ
jgi:hypothetical protein